MSAGAWTFAGVIVTALMGLAVAFGGWVTARAGRKASPYDALEKRVVYLEEKHAASSQIIDDQATEIAGLKRRVSGVIQDRDDLVRYITILRAWIAAGAKPPAPAVPEHLADVVPQWIPGDGAEPPPSRRPEPKETP